MSEEGLLAGGDVAAGDQLQGLVGAGLLGEDARLRELAESRGALGAAPFDVARGQADSPDDGADHHHDDDRRGDQTEVERPIRAPEHDHRTGDDRCEGDDEQRETRLR